MVSNELNIEVRDSVFDPNLAETHPERKIHVRKEGEDTYYYKVWIYLDGQDLPFVNSVEYTLHDSFPNPFRTVPRTPSNPNCQLVIWTWGLFTVKAMIVDKKGFTYTVDHELTYARNLPTESEKYVYEEEDPTSPSRPRLVSA